MVFTKLFCFYMTLTQHLILCREYQECQGINGPDIVVPSEKSCAKYIFCNGENSYEGECLTGNYFNEKIGACDDLKKVKCNIEPSDDFQSIYDEQEHTIKADIVEVSTQITDITTYMETSVTEENKVIANNTNTVMQIYDAKCPDMKGIHNIKLIAYPESCVSFNICYNGRAISMLCPSKMYFNENTGRCEAQMPESCKKKYLVRLNCFKGVYDFVPHPYRCEYYFYCLNGYLMIMRCLNDLTWHFERGTCVEKSNSKCYSEMSVIYHNDY